MFTMPLSQIQYARRKWLACVAVSLVALLAGCDSINDIRRMGRINELYEQIKVGTPEKELVAILGQPTKRMAMQGGEASGSRVRIYRYLVHNQILTFSVQNGAVIGKQRI